MRTAVKLLEQHLGTQDSGPVCHKSSLSHGVEKMECSICSEQKNKQTPRYESSK